jgi:hypothetical protein
MGLAARALAVLTVLCVLAGALPVVLHFVSCRERKKVEMPFAHLKRILRLGRLRSVAQMEPKTSSFAT